MSMPLLKMGIKSNGRLLLLFMGIITIYAGVITAMYDPELGEGINAMAESMPELFAAFGMQNPGITLLDFIINYLYGFILIVIPFIYTMIMCYKLAAQYIDKGSMAYLLNTHYSRKKILVTQGFVLLLGILLLVVYASVLVIVFSALMYEGELEVSEFLVLNAGLLFLEFFLAALGFLTACMFNELKYSVGIGAGLGLIFVLIQMLSQVNDKVNFLKYFTPLSLFMPEEIIQYEPEALAGVGILFVLTICLFTVSVAGFEKRDLPL